MCLGYVTVTVDYGIPLKTATVNNVNLQQCDGSEAQRWAYVSPQSRVTAMCRSILHSTLLTICLTSQESNGQISNMKAGCIEFANEPVNGNGNLFLSELSCGSCGMRREQVRAKSEASSFNCSVYAISTPAQSSDLVFWF